MSGSALKVAVFMDWQNVYRAARRAFGMENMPTEYGVFSPYRLAKILTAGNDRGTSGGELVRLQIHRGLPSATRDRIGYSANRKQAAAWIKENPDVVIPRLRPLRYPDDPNEDPEEKGIDVELALGAVEQLVTHRCDLAIIFSHDSDLLPVVETILRLANPSCVETAAWSSPIHRRRIPQVPGVYHHQLSQTVYQRVETLINYSHK